MKKRILLICHFSDEDVRKHLALKNLSIGNMIRKSLHIPPIVYADIAPWIPAFIKAFERHSEYEFHVVSHHYGMKKEKTEFVENRIHYHFIRQERGSVYHVYNYFLHKDLSDDFSYNRKRISAIVTKVNPELVVLCGAENPFYSSSVLDLGNTPLLVILQTLLNSPKRIEMGVGDDYRRQIEKQIMKKANFIACCDEESKSFVKKESPLTEVFDFTFPANDPTIKQFKKEWDFVFFARGIEKFKGIEDVLKAFAIVTQKHPNSSLEVIGDCRTEYKKQLDVIVQNEGLEKCVTYFPFFPSHEEAIDQVQKAKIAVLPGITAPLNGTVREAMLLGMPTLVYDNPVISKINEEEKRIFAAKMEDVTDLAEIMIYLLENNNETRRVASEGKKYADNHYSSESAGELLLSIINESFKVK